MPEPGWLDLAFWTNTTEDVRNLVFVLSIIAGGLIAGVFTYIRTVALHRQGRAADQGRFSTAIEQLGSPLLTVRLGGIYALERIAGDSKRSHWTIMEVLCAFLRTVAERRAEAERIPVGSRTSTTAASAAENNGDEDEKPPPTATPTDIQATLEVINRRKRKWDP